MFVCTIHIGQPSQTQSKEKDGGGFEGTMGNIQKISLPLPLSFLAVFYLGKNCYTTQKPIRDYSLMGIEGADIALRQDNDMTILYMHTESDYLDVNEKRICWDCTYIPDTRDHVDLL